MTATLRPLILTAVAFAALAAFPAVASADDDQGSPATQLATNDQELLLTFAAGLVGDAFGYDAGEVINQAVAIGMPVQDVVPTFYMAYLTGTGFSEVSKLRAAGDSWGSIADSLKLSADTLNAMALPEDFEITDPKQIDDRVYLEMFTCSAIANVYGHAPEDLFASFDAGWSPLDAMAASAISRRTGVAVGDLLHGRARKLDWYNRGREAGLDLVQLTRDHGRCTENLVPMMDEEPADGDLETVYSVELAADYWDVPIEHVRRARYRYLYSPSELMVAFYLGHVSHYDYYRVGRLYCHSHHRRWGPTIVALGIPTSHFSSLTIWSNGRVDFVSVDPFVLDRALLSLSLSYGCPFGPDYFYSRFDPWFTPCDAILYCGAYRRHGIYFDHYYDWRRHDRPRHRYPQFGADFGSYRRSVDWVGNHRVGAITGRRHSEPRFGPTGGGWYDGGGIHSGPRPGSGPGGGHFGDERTSRAQPGVIVGPAPGGGREGGFIRGHRDAGAQHPGGDRPPGPPTPGRPRPDDGGIGGSRPDGGQERLTIPTPRAPRSDAGVNPGFGGSRPDGGQERFTIPTPRVPRSDAGVIHGFGGGSRPDGGQERFTVPIPQAPGPSRGHEDRGRVLYSAPSFAPVGTPQTRPSTQQPPKMTQFGFGDPFQKPNMPQVTPPMPRVSPGSGFIQGSGPGAGRDDRGDRDRRRPGTIGGRRR